MVKCAPVLEFPRRRSNAYDDDGVEYYLQMSVYVSVFNVRGPSWLVVLEAALSFNIDVGIIVCSSIVSTEYLLGVWCVFIYLKQTEKDSMMLWMVK